MKLARRRQLQLVLTERQTQYLAMVANGYSRGQIAEILVVSVWTVDNTLKQLRERLACSTTEQALAKALALEELILTHDGTVVIPNWERLVAA